MRSHAIRLAPFDLGAAGLLLTANVVLGLILAVSSAAGVTFALAPMAVLALGALVASNRAVVMYAGLALGLAAPLPVTDSFQVGPIDVFPADLVVLAAVASWAVAWLVSPEEGRPRWPRSPLLGWPLLLFGVVLCIAVARGHLLYGSGLFSFPLRLLLYAGIAAAMTDLEAGETYRWIVRIFYAGTVWQTLVALHDLVAGTAATHAVNLSTGGERVLAGSTAMFMAGTLLLALLNLEFDHRARRAALHLSMAALATFTLVMTFQRTTFALMALLVPVFLLAYRAVGARLAAFAPLLAPFVVLAVMLVPRADPQLLPTLAARVTASPTSDTSVRWRERAIHAVWSQVREAPVEGVGFGRRASFTLEDVRVTLLQDPHNQYLFLWAGGGLLLLGSFVLLLLVYLLDSARRFRVAATQERRLVFWAVWLWFVFVVNSGVGIVITASQTLLAFWILMFLPTIVRDRRSVDVTIGEAFMTKTAARSRAT